MIAIWCQIVLFSTLIWAIDSKYLLTFQLLNYSNPYSRLNIGDQEYRCLYTYHTWQPKRLEHFKCRLIFTVLISPSSPSDIPYLSTTKMISLPADGDHKGTIDFAEEISLEKCSIPIKCTESTWTRPVQLKFETRPKWIRVLVEHVGSLVVDSTDRLVNLNQKFLVDDFWIDLAQQQYYDDAKYAEHRIRNKRLLTSLAYLVGLSPTTEECDSCNSGVFVDHKAERSKIQTPISEFVQRCELMKESTISYQLTCMILIILCLVQGLFLCMKFCSKSHT